MKRNMLLCFAVLLFTAIITIYAGEPVQKDEQVVLKEDFKQLTPAIFSAQDIERLKTEKYPVENLKDLVWPKNWFIGKWSIPNDLKMISSDDGWRFSTTKIACVYSPLIQNLCTDFSLNITLHAGEKSSTIDIGAFQYDLIHQYELMPLQKVSLSAGETKTIHVPVHFDFINPGFQIQFKITGDVTFQMLSVKCKPFDFVGKGYTCVEGTLEACSAISDPKKSDYPDCRFTCHFQGDNIQFGKPCPRELQLVIDGFKNYKLLGTNMLKAGDKVRCVILPFDNLPEKWKSTQQADDLELFHLNSYYAVKIEKIKAFDIGDFIPFINSEKQYVSIFERNINPPISVELKNLQQTAIAADIAKINTILEGWDKEKIRKTNEAFRKAWEAEKTKDPPNYNRFTHAGRQFVWRKIHGAYFSIPSNIQNLITQSTVRVETIDALVALRKAFESNGVQLIVSIIPGREPILARIVNKDFRDVIDYQTYSIIKILLEHGIEAVSPSKEVVDNFREEAFSYNIGIDSHPSVLVQKKSAEILYERIKRYAVPKRLKKEYYNFIEVEYKAWGNNPILHYPEKCDVAPHKPGARIKVKKPEIQKGCALVNKDSEILVVGNSFVESPYTSHTGLISWLTYYIESDVSIYKYMMNGPATVFIDNLLLNPEKYLKGKKVAVIQIHLGLLLSGGWHNIADIDRNLNLLGNSKCVEVFEEIHKTDMPKLNSEAAKIRTLITDGFTVKAGVKPFELAKITTKKIDKSKKIIVVVPVCPLSGQCQIFVNSIERSIPSNFDGAKAKYNFLVYELPLGTTEISVTVKGTQNSCFILKNIQIYQ